MRILNYMASGPVYTINNSSRNVKFYVCAFYSLSVQFLCR